MKAPRFSLKGLLLAVAWADLGIVTAWFWRSWLSFGALALAIAWAAWWLRFRARGARGLRGLLLFSAATILLCTFAGLVFFGLTVPHLLRSAISSNEASAIASLRTLVTSEEQYKASDGGGRFGSLADLNLASPPFIDSVLSGGMKSRYFFALATDGGENFTVHAEPVPWKTGWRAWLLQDPLDPPPRPPRRRFFADSSGVIRFNKDGPATSGSPPIE